MGIIYALIPLSLILAACGLGAYLWSVRNGQMEDLDTPAIRILNDDDDPPQTPGHAEKTK